MHFAEKALLRIFFGNGALKMDQPWLKDGERADDLLRDNLKIIQSDDVFSFSMDAVLLTRFCTLPAKGRVMDLCTGNGVVPLLLSTRTKAAIYGLEIQERLADMARRSVLLNGLERQITIVRGDLKQVDQYFENGSFDLVTVNPPYLPAGTGDISDNLHLAAARHELYCTLDDVLRACSKLVRFGGKVAIVHRPARLVELLSSMRQYRLEPKRIRFVHPRAGMEANMVLVEASLGGKPEARILPPLIVHDQNGNYCDELLAVYYGTADRLALD